MTNEQEEPEKLVGVTFYEIAHDLADRLIELGQFFTIECLRFIATEYFIHKDNWMEVPKVFAAEFELYREITELSRTLCLHLECRAEEFLPYTNREMVSLCERILVAYGLTNVALPYAVTRFCFFQLALIEESPLTLAQAREFVRQVLDEVQPSQWETRPDLQQSPQILQQYNVDLPFVCRCDYDDRPFTPPLEYEEVCHILRMPCND